MHNRQHAAPHLAHKLCLRLLQVEQLHGVTQLPEVAPRARREAPKQAQQRRLIDCQLQRASLAEDGLTRDVVEQLPAGAAARAPGAGAVRWGDGHV